MGNISFESHRQNVVSAVGPMYQAIEVNMDDRTTRLTVNREGKGEARNVQRKLKDLSDELKNHIESSDLSIGVTKVRWCAIVSSNLPEQVQTLAFHGVRSVDEKYLFVKGSIEKGDDFQYFHKNPNATVSSCIESLKLDKNEVLGGFIFSCYGCEESVFVGNGDCLPVMEEFPGVSLAGMFCGGEYVGDALNFPPHGNTIQGGPAKCCQHVRGSIYLVMAYTPAGSCKQKDEEGGCSRLELL